MWLTQRQRRGLEFYRQFRHEPMTWWHLSWAYRAVYLIRLLLVAAAIVVYGYGHAAAGLMLLCFVLGAQLRDAASQNALLAFWPALHEVIDWDKLEQLLDSQSSKDRPEGEE